MRTRWMELPADQLTSNYKHQDLGSVAPLGKGPDGVVVVLNSRYKQAVVAVGVRIRWSAREVATWGVRAPAGGGGVCGGPLHWSTFSFLHAMGSQLCTERRRDDLGHFRF
jgi:hypothetical protein